MPEAPKQQREEELAAQSKQIDAEQKPSPLNNVFRPKKFETSKRIGEIKQIKSGIDQVSALMHLTREEFQLEAAFDFKENGQAHARQRF